MVSQSSFQSVSKSVPKSVSQSVSQSLRLSLSPSVRPSACLSVRWSVRIWLKGAWWSSPIIPHPLSPLPPFPSLGTHRCSARTCFFHLLKCVAFFLAECLRCCTIPEDHPGNRGSGSPRWSLTSWRINGSAISWRWSGGVTSGSMKDSQTLSIERVRKRNILFLCFMDMPHGNILFILLTHTLQKKFSK